MAIALPLVLMNLALVGLRQHHSTFFVAVSLILGQQLLTAAIAFGVDTDGSCVNLQFVLLLR